MAVRKLNTFKNGLLVKSEDVTVPDPPTEEEQIVAWLAANPFADALIQALNKPPTDPDHLPPNKALPPADLVAKIKANLK